MKKAAWKKRIIESCLSVGTYRPAFDDVIDTLAWILETRDDAIAEYEDSGKVPTVEHTNRSGITNVEQNPVLRLINDLNRDALTHFRDLGLTAAGLKKIDENALKQKKTSSLAKVLSELG